MNKDPEMQGNQTAKHNPQTTNSGAQEQVVKTTIIEESRPVNAAAPENMVVAEATVETKMPNGQTVETTLVPKKKHKGFIIGAIIAFVVLILAAVGTAVWYFVYYNNPDKVAYDAISNFLSAKNVTVDGEMSGVMTMNGQKSKMTMKIDSASAGAAGQSTLTASWGALDANGVSMGNEPSNFKVGNVVLSDGVLYFRTDGLDDLVNEVVESMNLDAHLYDYSEIYDLVMGIVDEIDGEWWRISVPDIIDAIIDDAQEAKRAKEFYTCVVNVANSDVRGEVTKLYQNNQFVKVEQTKGDNIKAGNSLYNVSFDYDQMAAFVNAVNQGDTAGALRNCYDRYEDEGMTAKTTGSREDVTAADLQEAFDDTLAVQLEISNWGHQLTSIRIQEVDDKNNSGQLNFNYDEVVINAPEEYRSITDLVDKIMTRVTEAFESWFGDFGYGYDEDYDFDLDEDWLDDVDWSFDDDYSWDA